MTSASDSSWLWTVAKHDGGFCRWQPVPESEAVLLEHAHLESWDCLELTLDGSLYVIDPFFANAKANVATPIEGETGPVLLVKRVSVTAAEDPQTASVLSWLPPSELAEREKSSTHCGHSGLVQHSESSKKQLRDESKFKKCTLANTRATASPEQADGFVVVRRRRRPKPDRNSVSPSQKPSEPSVKEAGASQVALWRVFPKVDLEACGDYTLVRQVLVDGVDVALQHGGGRKLSPSGIMLAVAHFAELSFPVRVVVPQWFSDSHEQYPHLFTQSPHALLQALKEDDLLVVLPDPDAPWWKPSFKSFKTATDAERTIDLCKTFNAVLCSNDFQQFLHLMDENNNLFNDYLYIAARSCLYAFDGEAFYHVLDSLGRGKFVDTLFFRNQND